MANSPYGFKPVQTRDGNGWTGKTQEVAFLAADAAVAFVGDLVKYTGTATPDGLTPIVTIASASDVRLAGAIVRFDFDPDGYAQNKPTLTFRKAYIPVDRNVLYSAQEDSVIANLGAADVEANVDFVVGAGGNVTTGTSSYQIDSDSAAVTATLPLRLVRLEGSVGNTIGTNAQWLVTINEDAYSSKDGL